MQISGIIALLVTMVASRIINERGYRALSADEKVRLMDGFSRSRMFSLIPLVAIIGIFYFLSTQTGVSRAVLFPCYFAALIVYIVANAVFNQQKLQSLGMPTEYRRYFTASQVVSMLGVAWLFFTVFFEQPGF